MSFRPRQDPGSPYSGVITKFITNTLAHKPVTIFGDGKQTRDFVYVKDVVRANVLAMEAGKAGVYNVASWIIRCAQTLKNQQVIC